MLRSLVLLALALLAAPALLGDADVQTVVNFPPAGYDIPVAAGGVSSLQLTIFNNGPDVARNVTVRVELPAGVTIEYRGDSRCDFSALPIVTCRAGDVPVDYRDGAPTFGFDLRFPLTEANHTVVATATAADLPDPRPENNRITATYTTRIQVDLSVYSEPGHLRLDPGQTAPIRVSLNNFLPFSEPKDVRLHFDAANGAIERIERPPGWTCTVNGASADCVATSGLETGCACSGIFTVQFRGSGDRNGGTAELRTTATSSLPDFNQGNNVGTTLIQLRRIVAVTSAADSGSGTLRAAIEEANRNVTTPSKIAFEIPGPVPAEGWFTIAPSSPLPPVTAESVVIDGATQTALTGDTNPLGPEIALDGRFTAAGPGLELRSRCESAVEHVVIGNFRGHAVAAGTAELCFDGNYANVLRRVAGNYLGVDPTGKGAWPNLRGLLLRDTDSRYTVTVNVIGGNARSGIWVESGSAAIIQNWIGTAADGKSPLPNGASGIYLSPTVAYAEVTSNVIAFHPQMGVAVGRGAEQIEVRQNAMRDNGGLGIDWGLDGVNPQRNDEGREPSNAPVVLAATYQANLNRTRVTVALSTGRMNNSPFGPAAVLDFYANSGPDGDGEEWISGGFYATNVTGDAETYELQGDWRGKWINATSTRVYYLFAKPPSGHIQGESFAGGYTRTSELSNAVQVTE